MGHNPLYTCGEPDCCELTNQGGDPRWHWVTICPRCFVRTQANYCPRSGQRLHVANNEDPTAETRVRELEKARRDKADSERRIAELEAS